MLHVHGPGICWTPQIIWSIAAATARDPAFIINHPLMITA
jgi:hypothetical protein